jgi:nitrate reductase cytochrome c-type subunit
MLMLPIIFMTLVIQVPYVVVAALTCQSAVSATFQNITASTAKVKNAWNYTSTPPVLLHGVQGGNITNSMEQSPS